MSDRKVHIVRQNQIDSEIGIQQRSDDPSSPTNGQEWFNSVQGYRKVYLDGQTKIYAFTGESAGQTPYSTVVTSAAELKAAVSTSLNDTIYLRAGDYDLTTTANGLNIEDRLRMIGEMTGGDAGDRVRIYTDLSHAISVYPAISTVVSNGTITVTNNSTAVTLNSGTWATDLTGYYLFVNGNHYKIASNLTTTSLVLETNYTGTTNTAQIYFAATMLKDVVFENIEFIGKTTTHDVISIRNTINPTIVNCRFSMNVDSIYGKILAQYVTGFNVINNTIDNTKIDLNNNNYDILIYGNSFRPTVIMGSDPVIDLNTATSSTPISTGMRVCNNYFSGPAPLISIVSAKDNIISSNTYAEVLKYAITLDTNSHQNIIESNTITTIANSDTPIVISSQTNLINNNKFYKASGYCIDFASTATYNTVVGNSFTGGSTLVNDTLPANNMNRVEDDISRLGDTPTGTSKDIIDKINELIVTLQNKPEVLTGQTVAVDSTLNDETFVYWNTSTNQYEQADANDITADAVVGIATSISGSSGDIKFNGLYEFTNSGNAYNSQLFNTSYIGENFFLGVSGQIIPQSLFISSGSGVLSNQRSVGTLVDVVGNVRPQFMINTVREFGYGTFSSTWQLGLSDSSIKHLVAGDVSANVAEIVYNPDGRSWYVIKDGNSGEITQPYNRDFMANVVTGHANGTNLVDVTASQATVQAHETFIDGYRKSLDTSATVSPLTDYSGDVFIYNHETSGVVISSGIIDNATFLAVELNSGSMFNTLGHVEASLHGAMEQLITASGTTTTTYAEIARVYVPVYESGIIEFDASATTTASAALTVANPYQIATIKLQVDGVDVNGSETKGSIHYVSGETSWCNLHTSRIVKAGSDTPAMVKVGLMAKSAKGGSAAPAVLTNTSLKTKGL